MATINTLLLPVTDEDSSCQESITPRELVLACGRLVFQEEARGVPGLSRGWRTPDPSPMRGECGELPRCKAKQVGVVSVDQARGRVPAWSAGSRPCSPQRRERTASYIRTPSPSPSPTVRCIEPPMPVFGGYALPDVVSGYALPDVISGYPLPAPPAEPAGVPPPPQPWMMAVAEAGFAYNASDVRMVPSLGSVGHPYNCSQGCKYFTRAKGCKDGANCNRCHLCEWKRPSKGRLDGEAAPPAKAPAGRARGKRTSRVVPGRGE